MSKKVVKISEGKNAKQVKKLTDQLVKEGVPLYLARARAGRRINVLKEQQQTRKA